MGGGAGLPLWSTARDRVVDRDRGASSRRARDRLPRRRHPRRRPERRRRARRRAALDALRAIARVTFVAGNHEGRSRGAAMLGATVEAANATAGRSRTATGPALQAGGAPSSAICIPRSISAATSTAPAFLGVAHARRRPGADAVLAGSRRDERRVRGGARRVERAPERRARRRRDRRPRLSRSGRSRLRGACTSAQAAGASAAGGCARRCART